MPDTIRKGLRRAALALLAGGCLAALGGLAQARTPDFTIEQVMSAAFPSSLKAGAAGGVVAWASNKDGARNVWVAQPSARGYTARQLTAFTGDDGTDLGEIALDPTGRQVLFTRGGSLEGGGPVNIMSRPEGPASQDIWAAPLAGGEPRKIASGHAATPSPKGDLVAYLAGGQIWAAPLSGEGKPFPLIQDRGKADGLTWSPDGSKLAFVSRRGDHNVVGVYDFGRKAITWMQPGLDQDRDPQWSPDGRHVAFIRVPAGQGFDFTPHREGQPWSIWLADASTGVGHAIWTADRGSGSIYQDLVSGSNLMWVKGDRIVFPWEKSGWIQLYAVAAAGGPARQLTQGPSEVFNASVTPDGAAIVYSTNQGDIDHRHLWQVSVDGGSPKRLTSGDSIEDYPVVASDGRIAALHGDGRMPIEPVSVEAPGKMAELQPGAVPAEFPTARLVAPEQVVFTSPDGLQVHGQLFLPPKGTARGPALLFFHGGPIRQMLLGWHPMDAYSYMYAMNQYLANEGYVVLSVNYRGGTGYGLNFRQPPGFGPAGSSENNDIVGAARYLASRADVDPKRIGIWGGSYGGVMTALGLSRESDLLAAGVDYAGVHDWTKFLPPQGTDPEVAKRAYDASAVATVDRWRSPVMLIHADDDRNVPFDQSVELVQKLREHNVEVEQLVIPNEIHDLLRHQSWITVFGATDDFFSRKLMQAETK